MKKAVEKIPNGNADLLNALEAQLATTGNSIRNPKVKISSYLHSDDIADGMDWLTKIFTVNKEILKRIKENAAERAWIQRSTVEYRDIFTIQNRWAR